MPLSHCCKLIFQAIMDRRQNELRNTACLILKLRLIVAVQDLKISFYKQNLVPQRSWLVPPHFICSDGGTDFSIFLFL